MSSSDSLGAVGGLERVEALLDALLSPLDADHGGPGGVQGVPHRRATVGMKFALDGDHLVNQAGFAGGFVAELRNASTDPSSHSATSCTNHVK